MPILTHEERTGTVLAQRYRIDAILGRGGMGVVFKGFDLQTQKPLAIKLLNYEYAQREDVVSRFLREARMAAALVHPNIVGVLDAGTDADGTTFLVLEFLEGESLGDRLSRVGALSPSQAAEVLLPVMNALSFAHQNGVVHRDLKPDNLFLAKTPEGATVPKLLDFGIAKNIEQDATALTQTGFVLGTPEYMSPEQAAGARDLGPAADIWSMGVVWYECLSGQTPTGELQGSAVLLAVASGKLTPLAQNAPHLPAHLVACVERALHPRPEERYSDMASFADAVAQACNTPVLPVRGTVQVPRFPSLVAPNASAQLASSSVQHAAPILPMPAPAPPTPRSSLAPWLGLLAALTVLVGVVGIARSPARASRNTVSTSPPQTAAPTTQTLTTPAVVPSVVAVRTPQPSALTDAGTSDRPVPSTRAVLPLRGNRPAVRVEPATAAVAPARTANPPATRHTTTAPSATPIAEYE